MEVLEGAARDINVHVAPGWDALVEIRCRLQGWVEGVDIHGLVMSPLLNSETFLFHFLMVLGLSSVKM